VLVDGQLIFSKANAGRFPIEGEVEDLFAALKPTVKASAAKTTAGDPATDQSGGGGRAGMLRRLSDKFRN
jgi:hypothetical protein